MDYTEIPKSKPTCFRSLIVTGSVFYPQISRECQSMIELRVRHRVTTPQCSYLIFHKGELGRVFKSSGCFRSVVSEPSSSLACDIIDLENTVK